MKMQNWMTILPRFTRCKATARNVATGNKMALETKK